MEGYRHEANNLERIRTGFFKRLFVRSMRSYCRTVSERWRTALEVAVAIKAFTSLFILLFIHANYVVSPASCVTDVAKDWWPDGSVLRIEVRLTSNDRSSFCHEIPDNCNGTWIEKWGVSDMEDQMDACQSVEKSVEKGKTSLSLSNELMFGERNGFATGTRMGGSNLNVSDRAGKVDPLFGGVNESLLTAFQDPQSSTVSFDNCSPLLVAMEYSLEYGFLSLSRKVRMKHNISVWRVILDPQKNHCFRHGLPHWLLANLGGYDDMFMVSFKHMAGYHNSHGYLKNILTGMSYKFVDMDYPLVGILVALVVMIIFTTSVTLVLRQTHLQVFHFIVSIQRALETNAPITFPFAFMFTILLAVVGLENILTEFFVDSTVSFWVILMIWSADHFHSICCQSYIGRKYWWRFFLLYQFMFYCYHYIFNGQFSNIALVVCIFLVEHSMLFFVHHYEIPALLLSHPIITTSESFGSVSQGNVNVNTRGGQISGTPHGQNRQDVEGEELRHRQSREGVVDPE